MWDNTLGDTFVCLVSCWRASGNTQKKRRHATRSYSQSLSCFGATAPTTVWLGSSSEVELKRAVSNWVVACSCCLPINHSLVSYRMRLLYLCGCEITFHIEQSVDSEFANTLYFSRDTPESPSCLLAGMPCSIKHNILPSSNVAYWIQKSWWESPTVT